MRTVSSPTASTSWGCRRLAVEGPGRARRQRGAAGLGPAHVVDEQRPGAHQCVAGAHHVVLTLLAPVADRCEQLRVEAPQQPGGVEPVGLALVAGDQRDLARVGDHHLVAGSVTTRLSHGARPRLEHATAGGRSALAQTRRSRSTCRHRGRGPVAHVEADRAAWPVSYLSQAPCRAATWPIAVLPAETSILSGDCLSEKPLILGRWVSLAIRWAGVEPRNIGFLDVAASAISAQNRRGGLFHHPASGLPGSTSGPRSPPTHPRIRALPLPAPSIRPQSALHRPIPRLRKGLQRERGLEARSPSVGVL